MFRWRVVSPRLNPPHGGPPILGCSRLIIQCTRSYPPWLEAVPSSAVRGRAMLWGHRVHLIWLVSTVLSILTIFSCPLCFLDWLATRVLYELPNFAQDRNKPTNGTSGDRGGHSPLEIVMSESLLRWICSSPSRTSRSDFLLNVHAVRVHTRAAMGLHS
jgi:hypothetical protein